MKTNARVLVVENEKEARHLMEEVGVHRDGVDIMLSKASHRLLKLEQVDVRAANIIKQEILSRGGEAAVSWSVYALAKNARSDVLLMGTIKQLEELYHKLKLQPFGLADVAEEIKEALNNFDAARRVLKIGKTGMNFGERTYVMGVLNVTPDSFSDGGKFLDEEGAVSRGIKMVEDGADIIDIGGESTRPGAKPVGAEEELKRVVPVVEKLAAKIDKPISVDTYKSEVARRALDAGAALVNDISALRMDDDMAPLLAERDAPVILMHMRGTPQNMQENPTYKSVMGEIISFLRERLQLARSKGIKMENILVDPGIGFGKTVQHNLEILRKLVELKSLGCPVVVGTSRKSFIGHTLDLPVEERLEGTAATVALSVANGANIVRVHDVKEMVRVVRMTDAILR